MVCHHALLCVHGVGAEVCDIGGVSGDGRSCAGILPSRKNGAGNKTPAWGGREYGGFERGLPPVARKNEPSAVEACVSRGQGVGEAIDHDIKSDNIPARWCAERGQSANRFSD
jgi:hypothetical protein